jgi:hypothetical protein
MITDREAVALEVMQTDDLMAVGHWQDTIKSLVAKGYARQVAGVWHRSTPAGQEAFEAFEAGELAAMRAVQKPADDFDGLTIEGEAEDEH